MENVQATPAVQTPSKSKPPKLKLSKPKKGRKWIKRVIALAVIAAIAFFLLRSCTSGGAGAAVGAYLPSTASYQDMTVFVSGTGTIEPNQSYRATTLIQGEILEAPFEEGQVVHKGDLLFRIDSSDVETSISQAELSLQQTQLALQQAQLSLQQAQRNYEQLLKNQADNQKDRTIKAVEGGVITELYVDQGDNVMTGTLIADILDRDHMKLTVPFHSVDAAGFFVGQTASVTVDGTMETLTGTIDSIAATDSVGAGGALVRNVTILVNNPGALSNTSTGTAAVGSAVCASGASFAYAASKQVFAKATGELETLSVKEGDRVTKDQVIGMVAETDMETQIANARDAVESARVSVETTNTNVENARLALEQLRDRLDDYSITSTIEGTVIEKNYEVGDNIDATTASASGVTYPAVIYDLSALTFDMTIDERDISQIQVGQKVEITADALDGKSFTGTVDKVNINGVTVNGKTTYPVTVLVDGAPSDLYPGMNVSAKIIVEEVGRALCIPVDYVSRGNIVLVALPGAMDENGVITDRSRIEERAVTLGRSNEEYIEILDGLEDGDVVLIENHASSAMAAMMGG